MYTPELIDNYRSIIMSHKGRDNPITKEALRLELGMGERQLRELNAYMMDNGFPLCSADDKKPYGYYFPASPKEAEDYYFKQRKETITRMVRIRKNLQNTRLYYARINEGARQLELEMV